MKIVNLSKVELSGINGGDKYSHDNGYWTARVYSEIWHFCKEARGFWCEEGAYNAGMAKV